MDGPEALSPPSACRRLRMMVVGLLDGAAAPFGNYLSVEAALFRITLPPPIGEGPGKTGLNIACSQSAGVGYRTHLASPFAVVTTEEM